MKPMIGMFIPLVDDDIKKECDTYAREVEKNWGSSSISEFRKRCVLQPGHTNVGVFPRQEGKTTFLKNLAVIEATKTPGRYLFIGHNSFSTKLVYDTIKEKTISREHAGMRAFGVLPTLELLNGSQICFINGCDEQSIRSMGNMYRGVFIDEPDTFHSEHLNHELNFIISEKIGYVVMVGTPKSTDNVLDTYLKMNIVHVFNGEKK